MATSLKLPGDILKKEAFKTLPAKGKEEYLSNLLKKILDLNSEGITISQVKEATGLTYSTIWHHLEILSCKAQCRKISHGNLDVYYSNGEVAHLNDYSKGKAVYSLGTVENNEGRFVCIHEKRDNRSGNQTVCKGIAIPYDIIDKVISELEKVKKRAKR